MALFICYSKCSTCKKAEKWLQENNISYTVRPIKEENPTKEELALWHEKSGLDIKRFFNTSGNLYKEMKLKDKLPEMSLVDQDTVLVGFKQAEWDAWKESRNQ